MFLTGKELDPTSVGERGVVGDFQPMTWDWAMGRRALGGLVSFRKGYWPWRRSQEIVG